MKNKILKTILVTLIIISQLMIININKSNANIKEGDNILLQGDHECDSLLEYWMEDYQKWSYKIVWYVYYLDPETKVKYPAFCIQPERKGVGTGYDSYNASITKEKDNTIWRILTKGYMGSKYKEWNLECDDDLYSATKVALHSYAENISPKEKYIVGNREVDGNTVEEIQRRGSKVLDVAQKLYEYGINGKETYLEPKINISENINGKVEKINEVEYYTKIYNVSANNNLKSYEIQISNFPKETKIFNSNNIETTSFKQNSFKIAIPINNIKKDINGKIHIKNALINSNPIFYCKSSEENAQNYVTYVNGYENTDSDINLEIKGNNSNLKIRKIDKSTKEVIPNVTFEIKNMEDKKIGEITTNNEGIAIIKNIYPQKVKIKEAKVPEGYVINEEEKEIQLEWGKEVNIQFENRKIEGKIKIIKVSEDDNEINGTKAGTPLKNVEFEIYNDKQKLIETIITDENGIAISKKLEFGKYIIKEIKTDEDYQLNEKEFIVNITKDDKIEELIVTNKSREIEKLPRTGF